MDASRRARPQVEPFEDRVVPSRGGFDHGPDHFGGPRAAVVREQPSAFDHAGPYVGTAPARRGPDVTFTLVRVTARAESAQPAAEAAAPLVVAAAQAEPATAASFLPPTDVRAAAPNATSAHAPMPAPGVLVETGAAGVRAAAFTTSALMAAAVDTLAPVEIEPSPVVPQTPPAAPAWEFPPLLVEVPGAVPLAGALGVDLVAVEAGVRQALRAVAELTPLPADGWGADGWVAAAAALLGGAGWAAARARRPRPTPDAVFLGWGERDDRRRG